MPAAEAGRSEDRPSGEDSDGPRFEMTGEEVLHRGWLITLTKATFLDPEGRPSNGTWFAIPGAVAIVAITDLDEVVMVHQYRPALDQWLLEIPAGTSDVTGEPDEVTARRELAEEVGYAAVQLLPLTRCAITPGFCDELSTIFVATGLTPVPLDRQGIEERHMRVEAVPLDRFDAMVDDGTIIDATTILGVGLARRHLAAGR